MMNQMRHNFGKINSLATQIIDCLTQYHINNLPHDMVNAVQYEICHTQEKPWQSATYDGVFHLYNLDISWPADIERRPTIDKSALNTIIAAHEFYINGAFVADIKIANIMHQDSKFATLGIEALVINEE